MPIIQSILLLLPWLLTKFTYRMGTEKWLSPVVLCWIVGILICNLSPWQYSNQVPDLFSKATIILAIPLLLYSTDLIGWFKLAKTTILSFLLVILSVLVSAIVVGPLFSEELENSYLLSGMLTGVFIGGTPNMNSVGIAMGADEATFITLNATELLCGGIYLIFLTSVAHRFYGFFLKDFSGDRHIPERYLPEETVFNREHIAYALGLTLLLAAAALGICQLLTGGLQSAGVIILSISALAVAASFSPVIRNWQGPYEVGEYLLLMFCLAIGMMADVSELFAGGGTLLMFTASSWFVALSLHLLLCRLFGIDRDTMMITQNGWFLRPPFYRTGGGCDTEPGAGLFWYYDGAGGAGVGEFYWGGGGEGVEGLDIGGVMI